MLAAHQLDDFVHADGGQVHAGGAIDLDRRRGGRPRFLGRRAGQTLVMKRVRPEFRLRSRPGTPSNLLRSPGSPLGKT